MVKLVFHRLGVDWEEKGQDIFVPKRQSLTIEPDLGDAIPEISVMPWPAFPTDLMSIAIVIATQSKGTVLFHDSDVPQPYVFHRQTGRHGCANRTVRPAPLYCARSQPLVWVRKWKARIFAQVWRCCWLPYPLRAPHLYAAWHKLTADMKRSTKSWQSWE